jgi:hypothetical protein
MSYIVPKEIPNCCGRCPCFHAEKLMYCQAVKADKNKRIYAPYGEGRPDWCPLVEVKTPHGRLIAEKTITEIRYHDADGYHIVNGEQLCELEIDAGTVIEAEGSEG